MGCLWKEIREAEGLAAGRRPALFRAFVRFSAVGRLSGRVGAASLDRCDLPISYIFF